MTLQEVPQWIIDNNPADIEMIFDSIELYSSMYPRYFYDKSIIGYNEFIAMFPDTEVKPIIGDVIIANELLNKLNYALSTMDLANNLPV